MPDSDRSNPTPRPEGPKRPSLRGRSAWPVVELGAEEPTPRGWSYSARIVWPDDRVTEHTLTLSFADHDYWSGGASSPSHVAEVAARAAAVELVPERVPARVDCSTLRRLVPGFDERVQAGL